MGDIGLSVVCSQRQRDALDVDRTVTVTGGHEGVLQQPVDFGVVGAKPVADSSQSSRGKKDATGGVGVNNASGCIYEKNARAESIKGICKLSSFRFSVIQQSADKYRPPDMGRQQLHAPSHLVVHQTIALVTKNGEHRHVCR